MTRSLELDDIQGNVIRAYGKFGYPKARYFFLSMTNAWVGRMLTREVMAKVTTARRWPQGPAGAMGPPITMNMGFTFMGLWVMDLPTRTLQSMPDDFIDGMKKRAFILGDRPEEDISRQAQPIHPDDPIPDWMQGWDPIWQENRSAIGRKDVHIWISMNAQVIPGTETPLPGESGKDVLEERTEWLLDLCNRITADYKKVPGNDGRGKIEVLTLNGKPRGPKFQQASAIFEKVYCPDGEIMPGVPCPNADKTCLLPTPKEHFGMADGIGDPVFEGQFDDTTKGPDGKTDMQRRVKGRGKWMTPDKGWEPLATGEFLLGHPDESQELPPAARPPEFSANGTFMAFRKLHENVASWRKYFADEAKKFAAATGTPEDRAETILHAKTVGRWPDGVPLIKAPTWESWQQVRDEHGMNPTKADQADQKKADAAGAKLLKIWKAEVGYLRTDHATDFKYAQDIQGYDCPTSSHLRRANTRDYLDPTNIMDPVKAAADPETANRNTSLNKRRRIMRRGLPYGSTTIEAGMKDTDKTEQGVAMMIVCANLFRQFEFVQQQWIQYGLDFNAGNNTCPLLGNHDTHDRFTIPGSPERQETPYVCSGLKTFVEPRGGEYFFIPSMTALRMIADGVVDPT